MTFSPPELQAAGIEAYLIKPVKLLRLFDCVVNAIDKVAAVDISFELTTPSEVQISSKPDLRPSTAIRVLLAEDSKVNQKVAIARVLKMGYRTDGVMNGLQVLEALQSFPYDLILMDCQMPEMDGYQATRAIRQREQNMEQPCPWNAPVYIIALTAHAMEGDREKCLEAGMNDYLSKPMLVPEFQAALKRWQQQISK